MLKCVISNGDAMLFFIKHTASSFLMAPTINLLFIVTGMVLLKFSRKPGRSFVVFGIVTLWLLSTPMIAQCLIAPLQNKYPVLASAKLKPEKNTAIVVLEAGLKMLTPEYGNKPIVSESTLIRLRYAAFLYDKTHAPILVSGNDPYHPDVNQTKYMAEALKTYFNAPTRWEEDKGYDTGKEAVLSVNILRKAGVKKIYLVTHAFHMERSVDTFQGRGIQIIPAPTGYEKYTNGFGISNFIPSVSAIKGSNTALHEYIGMLWYKTCNLFNI